MTGRSFLLKHIILFGIIFFFGNVCAYSSGIGPDDASGLFLEGNKNYQDKEYIKAQMRYEELIDGGMTSGNIYYNLGNTYFRLGQIGRARLNYERAKRLMPGDPDIKANLKYLIEHLPVKEEVEKRPWYQELFINAARLLTADTWLVVTAGAYFVLFALLIASLYSSGHKLRQKTPVIITVMIIAASAAFGLYQYKAQNRTDRAVIISRADVRYSPSFQGAEAFNVDEGFVVDILREDANWIYIRFGPGKSGWIPKDVIEKI